MATGDHTGTSTNFKSFGDAMLVLFRCSTGEKWHLIMYDVVTDREGCVTEEQTPEDLNIVSSRK